METHRREVSPVAALGGILVLVGLWLVAQVIWPASPDALRWLNLTLAVIVLVLGLVSMVGRHHFGEWWVLGVLLAGNGMVACSTLADRSAEGQLINGFFLLMITVFSAYFLRKRPFITVLATGMATYSLGLVLNPQLDVISYALLINVLVLAVSVAVAYQKELATALIKSDPLTGVLNRRGLEEFAYRARALADRDGKETTVIVIDLDGFKQLNDRCGHSRGDEVLMSVASDWASALRQEDVLARIGGDEFVIVLPGMSIDDARSLAQRLRALNDTPWTFGCAVWRPEDELTSALNEADHVMYSGKRHRR